MSIENQRRIIADAIAQTGIQAYPYVPPSLNPPCAFVRNDSGDYYRTFQIGSGNRVFEVVITVPLLPVIEGQMLLDKLLEPHGAQSIPGHINDADFGTEGKILAIGPYSEYGGRNFNDVDYIGAILRVEVLFDESE